MDQKEQSAGEKRVRDHLVKPLLKLGLMRPSGMTIAAFDEMCDDVCKRLAYMDELSLDALCESGGALASGPNKDRFPIGKTLLNEAARIQPPADSDSPLLRKFFRAVTGRRALEKGYGPEIRQWLLKHRTWPTEYTLQRAEAAGAESRARLRLIEEKLAGAEAVAETDLQWRAIHLDRQRRCEALAGEAVSA